MSFDVGQLVVCINDVFSPCQYWRSSVTAFPKLNGIYTIRSVREAQDLIGLCFHEIVSPPRQFAEGFVEPAFNSKNFRPVKKTSIEVFERLLRPADPPTSEQWVEWPADVTVSDGVTLVPAG
jgi:hypothetical protein